MHYVSADDGALSLSLFLVLSFTFDSQWHEPRRSCSISFEPPLSSNAAANRSERLLVWPFRGGSHETVCMSRLRVVFNALNNGNLRSIIQPDKFARLTQSCRDVPPSPRTACICICIYIYTSGLGVDFVEIIGRIPRRKKERKERRELRYKYSRKFAQSGGGVRIDSRNYDRLTYRRHMAGINKRR